MYSKIIQMSAIKYIIVSVSAYGENTKICCIFEFLMCQWNFWKCVLVFNFFMDINLFITNLKHGLYRM